MDTYLALYLYFKRIATLGDYHYIHKIKLALEILYLTIQYISLIMHGLDHRWTPHKYASFRKNLKDIHVLKYTHISTTHNQALLPYLQTYNFQNQIHGLFLFLFLTIIVLCPIKILINDIFNIVHLCFSILNTNILLFTNYSRMYLTFILFYEKINESIKNCI